MKLRSRRQCLFWFTVACTVPFSSAILRAAPTLTYVTDPTAGAVYSIDPVTNTATHTIKNTTGVAFDTPCGVAISPDQSFAYLSDTGLTPTIFYIDAAAQTATETIVNDTSCPFCPLGLRGIATSPDQRFAYLCDRCNANVYYIDNSGSQKTATQILKNTSGTDFQSPLFTTISPEGDFAYVTDPYAHAIFYIDTDLNTATQIVTNNTDTQFEYPECIALSPDQTFAYVTDRNANAVFRIDTATNTVTQTIINATDTPFSYPKGVSISPDGSFAYVTNANSTVFYIDTASNTATQVISVPYTLWAFLSVQPLRISPDGTYALTGGGESETIYRIDAATNQLTEITNMTSTPFAYPTWIAFPTLSKIRRKGLNGNNLILAKYLNVRAPSDVVLLFSLFRGSQLTDALQSAAPTRNAFSIYASQTTQLSLEQLVNDHLRQKRWQNHTSSAQTAMLTEAESFVADNNEVTFYQHLKRANEPKSCPRAPQNSVWCSAFGAYAHVKPKNQTPDFNTASGGVVAAQEYNGLYPHPLVLV